MKCGGRYRT